MPIAPSYCGGTYCTTSAQNPLMHWSPVPAQQSADVVHLSSAPEQPIGDPHEPALQAPPQQSIPLVHDCPVGLHGASVANARMLPLASSSPGRWKAGAPG